MFRAPVIEDDDLPARWPRPDASAPRKRRRFPWRFAALVADPAGLGDRLRRADAALVRARSAAAGRCAGRGSPPEPDAARPIRRAGRHLWRCGGGGFAPVRHAALSAGSRRVGRGTGGSGPIGASTPGAWRVRFLSISSRGLLRQGGSTITQQVAKNLFLTNARTFGRKVQELMLTIWLERHFSKTEILEIWLNRVYLGSGALGHGCRRETVFRRLGAASVAVWQSAVLAGLPRAHSRFNPRTDPKAAAARGREGVGGHGAGRRHHPGPGRCRRPRDQFRAACHGRRMVRPTGPPARPRRWSRPAPIPCCVPRWIRGLQTAVEARLHAVLEGPGVHANAHEGAVVVLDSATGAVRAMAGGRDYEQGAYNRATLARAGASPARRSRRSSG